MSEFVRLLASFLVVIFVLSLHEFAHAFVAYKCGDPTAKFSGRMTLNPFRHFDPLGMVCFAIAGFGWAKPVPVNAYNFKNYKWGSFWTSIAGVFVNYLTAFLFYPLFLLTVEYVVPMFAGKYLATFLYYLGFYLYYYSLSFCAFNLIPLYPLDGFRVVETFNKRRGKIFTFLRNYGHYILTALIFINIFADRFPVLEYINVLGFVMRYVILFLETPIARFWGLFGL